MKTIRASIDIARSQKEVFDLAHDYSKRLEWDPYLSEAYLLNNAPTAAVGVDAYCKNHQGQVMITRYISFNPPAVAAVSMVKGPKILKRFSGAWNVKPLENGHAELIFTYHFELRYGVLDKLVQPYASYRFSQDMKKRLHAIKAYMEA